VDSQKEFKVGIKFPNGNISYLIFGKPTKNGFVYGVSHSDMHYLALLKGDSISFHSTNQISNKRKHLGRVHKSGDFEDIELRALNPRRLSCDEYDKQVLYVTNEWVDLFEQPAMEMIEINDSIERILLLDLQKTFDKALKLAQAYVRTPNLFVGVCKVGDILNIDNFAFSITYERKGILVLDGTLFEVDLLRYYDITQPDNPFNQILTPLGIPDLMPELKSRLIEAFRENLKDEA
jgi:hypothetical protein